MFFFIFSVFYIFQLSAQPIYKNHNASTEERVADLLSRMTLQEKIGQLSCLLGWEMYEKVDNQTVRPSQKFLSQMDEMPIGAFWATLRADPWTRKTLETGLNPRLSAEALNALQKYAMENTRLGIPIFFAEECMHGHMAIGTTVFPTSIGQASTWNRTLIEKMGAAIAHETRSQGAHIAYGPVLDLAREPRWSRVEETFGEDPVLSGILGSAFVRGLQGKDFADGRHTYSTLKHLAAYGIPVGGHNGRQAQIGARELIAEHLLPFEMAVKAGAQSVMTSYNAVDGVPCTSNTYILKKILRGEWDFNGFVVSDLGSIEGIATTHRVAPDIKHAAAMALNAGVEMDLGGVAYTRNMEQAHTDSLISMSEIDDAVSRILRLKFEMGLFESPYVQPSRTTEIIRSKEHNRLARKVAEESIVLLKNNANLLPLSKNIGSIAVIGPNADNLYNQLGDYTAPQPEEHIVTILEGIRNAVSPTTVIRYVKGCAVRDTTQSNIDEAVRAANASSAVVLVVGGSSACDFRTKYIETGAATVSSRENELIPDMESGEGYDRKSLTLLGHQEKLIESIAATGKPLIMVYIQGRPLNMNLADKKASALLTAWYPGEEGGNAVANVIFGDVNPSGRLPISVPRSTGQLPVYYSLGKSNDYVEGTSTPLYAFGYGLSYTAFEYGNLTISREGGNITVSCTVTNTGNTDGDEVVQLYLRDHVASVSVPPVLLKDFAKISLKKGESARVNFVLTPEQLAFFNTDLKRVVEPGEFTVMIGAASNDIRLKESFVY